MVHVVAVSPQTAGGEAFQIVSERIVVGCLYAGLLQVCLDFLREFHFIYIEAASRGGDECVGREHRGAVHVGAAQIQCPRDLVERREDKGIRLLSGHGLSDESEFLRHVAAREAQRLYAYGSERGGRSASPQTVGRIGCRFEAQAVVLEFFLQGAKLVVGYGLRVYANDTALRNCGGEPLHDGRGVFLSFLHQTEGGVLQLPGGGNKVAGVGP